MGFFKGAPSHGERGGASQPSSSHYDEGIPGSDSHTDGQFTASHHLEGPTSFDMSPFAEPGEQGFLPQLPEKDKHLELYEPEPHRRPPHMNLDPLVDCSDFLDFQYGAEERSYTPPIHAEYKQQSSGLTSLAPKKKAKAQKESPVSANDSEVDWLRARLESADEHVRSITEIQASRDAELISTKEALQELRLSLAVSTAFVTPDDGGDTNQVIQGTQRVNKGIVNLVFEIVEDLDVWKTKAFTEERERALKGSDWRDLARKHRKDKTGTMTDFLTDAISTIALRLLEDEVFRPFAVGLQKEDAALIQSIHGGLQQSHPQGYSARWRSLTFITVAPDSARLATLASDVARNFIVAAETLLTTVAPSDSAPINLAKWTAQATKRVAEAMDLRALTQAKFLSHEHEWFLDDAAAPEGMLKVAYGGLGLRQLRTVKSATGAFALDGVVLVEPEVVLSKKAAMRPAK